MILTRAEAQSLLDALDTLDSTGTTPITADLDVLLSARHKLERYTAPPAPKQPCCQASAPRHSYTCPNRTAEEKK